jgi:hypothetical protein
VLRIPLILLCIVALAACSEKANPSKPKKFTADLHVKITGVKDGTKEFDVNCPGDAKCDSIEDNPSMFGKPPSGTACTMQYGGPAVARVTGTIQGKKVDTTVKRTNGCEIARWDLADGVLGRQTSVELH